MSDNWDLRPIIQYRFRNLRSSCFRLVVMCLRQVSLRSRCTLRYESHKYLWCFINRKINKQTNIFNVSPSLNQYRTATNIDLELVLCSFLHAQVLSLLRSKLTMRKTRKETLKFQSSV